jgi:hypothetical protein
MYRISNLDADLEGITEPLTTAIRRCLQREPGLRPSVQELLTFFSSGGQDDLPPMPDLPEGATVIVQPAQIDKVVQSARQPSGEPPADKPTRRKGRMIAVLLLLVALAGGGAFAFLQTQSEEDTVAAPAITTTTTSQATTTTEPPATTTKASVTTTTRPRVTTTTTKPPVTTTKPPVTTTTTKPPVTTTTTKPPVTTTTTKPPVTTTKPPVTTTTLSAAFLAERATLTDTYPWGYSEKAKNLQDLLGLTDNGNYGEGTRIAHMAVLEQRQLATGGVPTPPPTTTTTTTTTTIACCTHPSPMEKPTVGTPYLSDGTYAVVITWTAPGQTGSSAIESYEINQAYYSETKTWTVSGTTLSTTADSLIGSRHYAFRVRAINEDGRKGPWSDILPVPIPSVPVTTTTTTTTTLPPPTTTFQIASTTTSAPPRYKLNELGGKNGRWDPCKGQIRMKLNHAGRLDSTQLNEWETELVSLASGIATATGLNFVYVGTTAQELAPEHPGEGRHPVDILVVVAPGGTGLLEGKTAAWHSMIYYDSYTDPVWSEIDYIEIQVTTSYATGSSMWPYGKKYLMNKLGHSFGLDGLDDGIDTEIMSWGSNGSGSSGDPQWGTGDLIGFGLVGANGGCVN